MHAHKMTITVPESGHVELDPPSEFRGGEAEVIVLFPRPSPARLRPGTREALLAADPVIEAWRAGNPDKLRTADEIDAQIAEERASWGDDR
jgi:hypothetical protein